MDKVEERTCQHCGQRFEFKVRKNRGKFCSRRCSNLHQKRPAIERFRQSVTVDSASGCFLWCGTIGNDGYGQFADENGRRIRAHRFAWMMVNGEIPRGFAVLHKCDNPRCVNPAHLTVGTNADNSADMVNKGRQAIGTKHGLAKLDESKVREIRTLYRNGVLQRELAAMFGIAQTAVSSIVRRRTWQHVSN